MKFQLFLNLIFFINQINSELFQQSNNNYNYHINEKDILLCKLIFLDLGANVGVQARRLYESLKFPKRGELNNLHDKYFKNNKENVCTISFEPNPRHTPRLKEMEAVYQSLGIKFYFFPYAVSTIDTSFQLLKPNSDTQMAASLVKTPGDAPTSSVTVKVINFLNFMKEFILPNKNIEAILCKMDIEGEEYNLLPALISSGYVCLINTLTVEFHLSRSSRFQDGFIKNFKRHEIAEFQKNLKNYTSKYNPNGCKTEFIKLDDELYHSDNLLQNPLPLYNGAPKECEDVQNMCILSKPIEGMTEQQYKETIFGVKRWA